MGLPIVGGGTGAYAEVEQASHAFRVTTRPIDVGPGGNYQLVSKSGTMAAGLAGAAPIYAFRNASPTQLCLIRRVKVSAWSLGTGFAAGFAFFDMFKAASWSAADTGGTTDTITVNNGKLRNTQASIAALAEIRHSSTATLTAGTRVLDAQPVATTYATIGTATNTVFFDDKKLFEKMTSEYPLVLAQNEGFVIQATVPATGTWTFAITPEWDEVTSY